MNVNKTIKIGVNARFLTNKFTGIGRYTLELFSELAKDFKDLEIVMVVHKELDEGVSKMFGQFENVKIVVVPENKWLLKINAGLAKSYWEKFQIRRIFREEKVDIIHLPYPSLTSTNKGEKLVVTVHDAIPWTVEEYKNNGILGKIYNQAVLKKAAEADVVLTVSNSSKDDLEGLKKIDAEKIVVVHNACQLVSGEKVAQGKKEEILEKYGVATNKPYLFYLGGYDKRKNVLRLVNIFLAKVCDNLDLQLVLGGAGVLKNNLFNELKEIKQMALDNPKVVLTGFIDETDLPILYSSAKAFITLSKSEGFNLNLLEAISLQTPAIVSDLNVHREVAGKAALWIDLNKTNREIGELIVNLLKEEKHYNQLREETCKNLPEFSWKKSAKKIYNIYNNLINTK